MGSVKNGIHTALCAAKLFNGRFLEIVSSRLSLRFVYAFFPEIKGTFDLTREKMKLGENLVKPLKKNLALDIF